MQRRAYMRQEEYQQVSDRSGAGLNVGIRQPQAVVPVNDLGLRLLKGLGDLGNELMGIAARAYRAREERRAQSAALAVEREFALWKADYMRENQGEAGLNAQADFRAKYEELAGKALAEFGKANEEPHGNLQLSFQRRGTEAMQAGAQFQASQQRQLDDFELKELQAGVELEFEDWKQDYYRRNQGIDARQAQADFTAKYSQLANAALDRASSRNVGQYLKRELFARGLYALRDGARYQEQQLRAYDASVWKATSENLVEIATNDPLNEEGLQFGFARARQQWRRMNPGMDDTAVFAELGQQINIRRFQALLEDDKTLPQAEALLAKLGGQDDQNGNQAAADSLAGKAAETGEGKQGKIPGQGYFPHFQEQEARRDIDRLPEDVKQLGRQAAQKYNIPEDLALAVIYRESGGDQSVVSKAGARGLMQLMPGTAKELGVDADDPAQNVDGGMRYLSRMLQKYGDNKTALLAYNWGPANVDAWLANGTGAKGQAMPKEAREYAGLVLGHAGSQPAGAIPSKVLQTMQKQLKARQEQAQVAALNDDFLRILDMSMAYDQTIGRSLVFDWVGKIEDLATRKKYHNLAASELAERGQRIAARNQAEASAYLAKAEEQQWSTLQTLAHMQESGVSKGAQAVVQDTFDKLNSKPTPMNEAGLIEGLVAIDNGALKSRAEREAWARNYHLTWNQRDQLMRYEGILADIPESYIQETLNKFNVNEPYDSRWRDAIARQLEKGKAARRGDVEKAVAKLVLAGSVNGNSRRFVDAVNSDKIDQWLPKLNWQDMQRLEPELIKRGIFPSYYNMQVLAREHMNLSMKSLPFLPKGQEPESQEINLLELQDIDY